MTGSCALKKDEAAISAKGSSFYAAMRIMPQNQRRAMYEIYRYCRIIDDIGDNAGALNYKLSELNQWRDTIERLYASKPPAAVENLARAVTDFGLRKEDFRAIIDGVEMDVEGPIQAPDMATLELYCDRVACAVGRLSVHVFGMQEDKGLALSHHLGMALQLTNILRDVDEDAALGRLYLPTELLHDAGITTMQPEQVLADAALDSVCRKLADKAANHFALAEAIMKQCSSKQVRTPQVMSEAYQSILTALMERGFAPPRRPVRISKIRLGFILLRHILF